MPRIARRKYSLKDAELIEMVDDMLSAATRDTAEMSGFGYDAARLAAIRAQRDATVLLPSDGYWSGNMMVATEQKNADIHSMSEQAESIVHRAIIKWGETSGQVAKFDFKRYSKQNDAEKIATCRVVHNAGTDYLADLAGQGLQQSHLDSLQDAIDASDGSLTAKRDSVRERDLQTRERIAAYNNLYDELVTLANTGKHIWENTDDARYNDYVIYGAAADGAQVVTGQPAAGAVFAPSVDVDDAADEIKFDNSGSVNLNIYFGEDPTDEPTAGSVEVAAGTTWAGVANDLLWSTQNFRFLVKNASATTGDFELRIG